jgi:uracil permease
MKVLIDNRINLGSMRNVIVVAAMLVVGLGKAIITFGTFSIYDMSLAALVGVLLNVILPQDRATELD